MSVLPSKRLKFPVKDGFSSSRRRDHPSLQLSAKPKDLAFPEGHFVQEENKSNKDQLSTMKLPPRRRDAHTWRGPQKSKTSNIGRLQVWPGKLCLRFNTNKLFRIYCVSDPVCSVLCTFSHLISKHSYEANGYHLHRKYWGHREGK